jgi:hypothetical protein
VRGLVVAVFTSKKGNTFLNFGGKYPNQTFTGYIPAGSELAEDQVDRDAPGEGYWHHWYGRFIQGKNGDQGSVQENR